MTSAPDEQRGDAGEQEPDGLHPGGGRTLGLVVAVALRLQEDRRGSIEPDQEPDGQPEQPGPLEAGHVAIPDDERERPGADEHGPTRRPGDSDRHRDEEQGDAERRREQEDGRANDGAQGDLRQTLEGRDDPCGEVLRFEPGDDEAHEERTHRRDRRRADRAVGEPVCPPHDEEDPAGEEHQTEEHSRVLPCPGASRQRDVA